MHNLLEKNLETLDQEKEINMRKVTVTLTVELTMNVDEGAEIQHIIDELDYNFTDTTTKADIEDTLIVDSEITDSR